MGSRHELGYAPPRSGRRRALVWRGIAVLAAIVLAWLAWRWLPGLLNQARYLYWQRQALRYTRRPDQPALETDRKKAAKLLKESSEYRLAPEISNQASRRRLTLASIFPKPFEELQLNGPLSSLYHRYPAHGIAFMHERRSPDGERYLVVVPYWVREERSGTAYTDFYGGTSFRPAGSRPGARLTPVYRSQFWVSVLPPHTIHFGVPDPADESHFVLDLEVDAYSTLNPPDHFIIDGWVRDGGMLEMIPRPGPVSDRIRSQPFGHSDW